MPFSLRYMVSQKKNMATLLVIVVPFDSTSTSTRGIVHVSFFSFLRHSVHFRASSSLAEQSRENQWSGEEEKEGKRRKKEGNLWMFFPPMS